MEEQPSCTGPAQNVGENSTVPELAPPMELGQLPNALDMFINEWCLADSPLDHQNAMGGSFTDVSASRGVDNSFDDAEFERSLREIFGHQTF
jgi:hypothetical protein